MFEGRDDPDFFKTVDWWRTGGLLDVTVQMHLCAGLRVYRFVLEPVDFAARSIARWSSHGELLLRGGPALGPPLLRLFVKLPSDRRLADGKLTTEWTFSAECFFGKNSGGPSKARLEDSISMTRGLERAMDGLVYIFERFRLVSKARPLALGDDAIAAVARAVDQRSAIRAQSAHAAAENDAYLAFFLTEHDPLSFKMAAKTAARARNCPSGYNPFQPVGNVAQSHRDDARSARHYGKCYRRLMERYDYAGYVARYPDLVAQENALWAETAGLGRNRVLTPQEQLDFARNRIDAAFDSAVRSDERAGRIKDANAAGARERAVTRRIFLQNQAMINERQRQVQDMTSLLRADGTVSSTGADRERAIVAGRLSAAALVDAKTAEARKTAASPKPRPADTSSVRGTASASTAGTKPAAPELPPVSGGTYFADGGAFNRPEGTVSEGLPLIQCGRRHFARSMRGVLCRQSAAYPDLLQGIGRIRGVQGGSSDYGHCRRRHHRGTAQQDRAHRQLERLSGLWQFECHHAGGGAGVLRQEAPLWPAVIFRLRA